MTPRGEGPALEGVTHQVISTNGIKLHVAEAGPPDGPLVILLHGFPEFWYGWRQQIPFLAEAGYRVWAPDQRGYNLSDKPEELAAYSLDHLAVDVIGLIDAAGRDKACLVAHDWGAGAAWWTAGKFPDRLEHMVILNCPHGEVFSRNLLRNPAQMFKSWYMLFFQIPRLPEALWRWAIRRPIAGRMSRNGMFTRGDPQLYRQAWNQPGAMTGMINWYRAAARRPSPPPASPRIRVPTLLIWGSRDAYLGRELAQPSIDLCDDGQLVYLEDASHWVQHEEAGRVNGFIDDFLRARG